VVDDPEALEAFLDAEPWSAATRLALADRYEELGEESWSRYYRWSALTGTWPHRGSGGLWYYYERPRSSPEPHSSAYSILPVPWCRKLGFSRSLSSDTRRNIERFLWRGLWGPDGPPQGLIDRLLGIG
jgi:hypothetical protein